MDEEERKQQFIDAAQYCTYIADLIDGSRVMCMIFFQGDAPEPFVVSLMFFDEDGYLAKTGQELDIVSDEPGMWRAMSADSIREGKSWEELFPKSYQFLLTDEFIECGRSCNWEPSSANGEY